MELPYDGVLRAGGTRLAPTGAERRPKEMILAAIYFGSSKITNKGLLPIGLIGISAVAGIIVYGLI